MQNYQNFKQRLWHMHNILCFVSCGNEQMRYSRRHKDNGFLELLYNKMCILDLKIFDNIFGEFFINMTPIYIGTILQEINIGLNFRKKRMSKGRRSLKNNN